LGYCPESLKKDDLEKDNRFVSYEKETALSLRYGFEKIGGEILNKKFVLAAFFLACLSTTMLSHVFVQVNAAEAEEPLEVWGDYTLDRDITFRENGFIIKMNGVTLDLNGHTITGSGRGYGVLMRAVSGVTVKNGVIAGFEFGIHVSLSLNNAVTGNTLVNNSVGVWLWVSRNISIYGNRIGNTISGIAIHYLHDSNITENSISNVTSGILLANCNGNYISKNTVRNMICGIDIEFSRNNVIIGNNVTNELWHKRLYGCWVKGVSLSWSSNIVLRSNNITGSSMNFGVFGESLEHFIHDIDTSNTVDGNPIIYWINRTNEQVPFNAGYVALVNCTNITVKNLTLTNNLQGTLLAYTTHSTITGSNMTSNLYGVYLTASNCNVITKNIVMGKRFTINENTGIHLDQCDNCTISANIAYNNFYGMLVNSSTNCTIEGNNAYNNTYGFYFNHSSQCVVRGNDARNNWAAGIKLKDCHICTISENILDNNEHFGIYLKTCTCCLLSENEVKNDNICIELRYSNNVILRRNEARNSDFGIRLLNSRNCTLRDNKMAGNKYNFGVHESFALEELIHDIDVSNKVDGRPVHYLVNQHDKQIPNDAGYVAVVNSTGVRVENLCLTHNFQGLLLAFTNHSTVRKTNTSLNSFGIQLRSCYNCTISGNNVSNNDYDGIGLENSHYCTIDRNNVNENHQFGIHMWNSTNNIVFHNNFVNNTWQALVTWSFENAWDNSYPSGGNYWSDYNGTDFYSGPYRDETGSDGIGDITYVIDENNQDRYPLMGSFNAFDTGIWYESYSIDVIGNSTVSNFQFNISLIQEYPSTVSFNVTDSDYTLSFCRVIIPNVIVQDLWQGNYTVLVNGHSIEFKNWTANTNTYIYFIYQHTTRQVIIIPEFPSALILPLFMTLTMLALILEKRKFPRKLKT